MGDFAAGLDEALGYAAPRKAGSGGRPVGSPEWLAVTEERIGSGDNTQ